MLAQADISALHAVGCEVGGYSCLRQEQRFDCEVGSSPAALPVQDGEPRLARGPQAPLQAVSLSTGCLQQRAALITADDGTGQ